MTLLLVGLGVIGSFVAPLILRTAQKLVLIDRDTVEDRNCGNQSYSADVIGMPKVVAMAAKLRSMWPAVSIDTYHADLADVPLGVYADTSLIFAGLDSLLARQSLGEIAFRLGKPWIDGGTADTSLGRVSFYAPRTACVECCFSAAHYRQLAMEYPCGTSTAARVSPTAASGALGATVAGLMASVYEQYVATADEPASVQLQFDLSAPRFTTARLKRSSACRFDHVAIKDHIVSSTPWDQATLRDLLDATSHLESVEFEVRRGGFRLPPLNTTRLLQREHILPLSDISLVESGLDPRDWVLVRSLGRPTAWLRWNSSGKREECCS